MRRGWAKLLLASACLVGCTPFGLTQAVTRAEAAPAKPLEFDVVSIRQNKSGSGITFDLDPPPNGYSVKNMSLKTLIGNVYGIRLDLISGPAWIETAHYDVDAKVVGDNVPPNGKLGKQERTAMLQAMLADRFKLVAHVETKELPGYELVLAKNGPKLKDSIKKQEMYGVHSTEIDAKAMKMPALAEILSRRLQRTVTDKTGLTGMYDFELKWASGQGATTPAVEGEPSQASDPGPSVFYALEEQLGLKLNVIKGPADTLVIDHVERPSEN
jgi:uncharacterized protein (TIGR03435 family)